MSPEEQAEIRRAMQLINDCEPPKGKGDYGAGMAILNRLAGNAPSLLEGLKLTATPIQEVAGRPNTPGKLPTPKAQRVCRLIGIKINCQCAGYLDIRGPLKSGTFPKCRACKRSLGDAEFEIVWRGTATRAEAWRLARAALERKANGTS